MKKTLVWILILIALLGIGGVWLYAGPLNAQQPTRAPKQPPKVLSSPRPQTSAPSVGTLNATPTMITMNTPTRVTMTIQITGPSLIPNSVNLLRLGATGTQPTILGTMNSIGNSAYSLQYMFNETTTGQIQLQVSAAFLGQLKRLLSSPYPINVWRQFTDPTTGIGISLPQFAATETISSTAATASSAATIHLNVVDPVDNQYVIPLLTFVVQANPQNLSFQAWFEQNVDYQGLLLNAGNIASQTLSNGALLFTLQGPFPQAYLNSVGGPIPTEYAMSADGSQIITIVTQEDPSLADIGISPSSLDAMLPTIIGNMSFQ